MSSALLLEKHFFTKIDITPNPDAKAEGTFDLNCSTSVGQASDDQGRYQITLTTTMEPDSKSASKPYYSATVTVVGFFRVAKGYTGDTGRLVTISGSTLLYGTVRELLCNLTARGPWPMVTIPTMNFTPEACESIPVPPRGELAEKP